MDLSFHYSFVLFVFSARRAKQHLNRSRDNMASFYVCDHYDYLEDDNEMEYER